MPLPQIDQPLAAVDYAEAQLLRATVDAKHPWHWPVLVTAGAGRVVVLRHYSSATTSLRFFTDRRSAKVSELADAAGRCSFTFYHPRHRTQLRVAGSATELVDLALRDEFWRKQHVKAQRSYASREAPGTSIPDPSQAYSKAWMEGRPSDRELAAAFANFTVFEVAISTYDLLQLSPDGQRRVGWTAHGTPQWLTP